ncbi:MAG TPA: 6,7-dimethyl-8-ribityllumazine synthase [Vicinamibacterales bacterium]|jgi:6,7-dimethyl-8-ribityllumazine synthase|nr:6,7-dimethyl-8-ribityllumazine synthase [Vicinamibacterales bacterium]
MQTIDGAKVPDGIRVALVVSKYHDFVTDRLQAGALAALAKHGIGDDAVTVVRVPGAFEVPMAARLAAESGRYGAIVCLGCLIRGATPHFDYIASSVSQGLMAASGETGVPMSFGVLTTNSVEEALERAGEGPSNKGWEAAMAALEMAAIAARLAELPAARMP